MQSGIFVRPNLKGFLVGGIVVVAFHCVLQQLEGVTTQSTRPPVPASVKAWSDSDFQAMLRHVSDRPTSDGFYKLGSYMEHRKDHKRAMMFIRKAEMLSRVEEDSE